MPLNATYQPTTLTTPLQFGLLIDPPNRHTGQQVSERIIPGSDNVVIDIIGKPSTHIKGKARFDGYQQLKTFEGAVGTLGTLVYSEELGGVLVILIDLNREWVNPRTDIHICSIEFILLPPDAVISGV